MVFAHQQPQSALNAGYLHLEVRCLGCDTHPTVALSIVRRPKTMPIHKLERENSMKVIKTEIPEILIFEPDVIADERGFFLETFQAERYAAYGVGVSVQDNLSRSRRGVLRGLHLQNPRPQGKLVTAVQGDVLDVIVDVRVGSPTFGRHVSVELGNLRQLWIPRGFAHGFVVASESADLLYRCDEVYSPADEILVRWNDPAIGIDWRCEAPILSPRDANAPLLSAASRLPVYGEV